MSRGQMGDFITIEDYQTINHNSQSARYEYLDGELRMLAGGSADHSIITANLTGILNNACHPESCLTRKAKVSTVSKQKPPGE